MISLASPFARLETAPHADRNHGTFVVDHESGVHYWSPGLKRIFGVPMQTDTDFNALWQLVHPLDRRRLLTVLASSLQPHGDNRFSIAHRVIRPDGSEARVVASARVFFHRVGEEMVPCRTLGAVVEVAVARPRAQRMAA